MLDTPHHALCTSWSLLMEQYALALETAINAFFSFEIYQQKNKKTDSFSFNLNETKNNYF